MKMGWRACVLAGAVVLTVAGCGTRISHSAVVAASEGGGTAGNGEGATPGAASNLPAGGGTGQSTGGGPAGGSGAAVTGPGGAASTSGGAQQLGASSATGGGAAAQTGSAAPIALGMIGTFSGILADGGQAGHDAVLAWARWVDAHGGIAGHQVTVYPEDDNADGATALSDAKDLVENKHVVAFVGNMQYSTMSAIEPYLRQKHIPVVGGDQSTPVWWSSPVLFPLGYGPNVGAWAEGKVAVAAGKPKIGILYCAESDACTLNEQQVANNPGVEQAGARVVYTAQISVAQPDYTAECLNAEQKGVGLLLVFADTSSVRRVADSCTRQGYHPMLGSGNADDSAGQDPNMEGYEQLTPVFSWSQDATPAQQEYAQIVQTYSLQRNMFTTVVYSSGKMFERVVQGIKGPVTSDAIFQSLWSISNETLGGLLPGPITYRANQPQAGGNCVIEQVLRGGHFVVGNGGQPICR